MTLLIVFSKVLLVSVYQSWMYIITIKEYMSQCCLMTSFSSDQPFPRENLSLVSQFWLRSSFQLLKKAEAVYARVVTSLFETT